MHRTYGLFPCPAPRHQITVLSLLAVEFLIWCVVDLALEIRTSEEVLDDVTRIPVPDVVAHGLPLRETGCFREGAVVL